ncbi:IclR family transcriptional regulator [Mycobacterium hodleri]|uniref:IclR family transcriptional regulator n=1 Tax=Mycolicibacterium hodleri TaxID=49897 RepID=UPI0021F2DD46|nr:IclR family transcriptional regulator [Mycolicibacterium hodleri]MCV7133968.1 IclR family transcriptional regulator [Mycolicibacterium hodleri]
MPGPIQALERATVILDLVERSDRSMQLRDIAQEVDLSKTTVHGILQTLTALEYLDQDPDSGAYSLGPRMSSHEVVELDGNDLRATAMPWADGLASDTGFEVLMTILHGQEAEVVHHVFRPDDKPQTLRVGELLPLHATGCGKLLLAYSPLRERLLRNLPLDRYTRRTSTNRGRLAGVIEQIRIAGVATGDGELDPDFADVAVAVHGGSRSSVAALALHGAPEELLARDGTPRAELLAALRLAAASVMHALEAAR